MGHGTTLTDTEARVLDEICEGITRGRDLRVLARHKAFASLWRKAQGMRKRADEAARAHATER